MRENIFDFLSSLFFLYLL